MFFALLLVPMLQRVTGLVEERELGGVESPPSVPELGWGSWFDGKFPQACERLFAHELGLRRLIVRTDNQITLSLFGDLKPPSMLGKRDILYSDEYHPFHAWWIGDQALLRDLSVNLRMLQDQLDARGVTLITIVSPSKSRLYPEDLPAVHEPYARITDPPTQAKYMLPMFDVAGARYVDFPRFFAERKASSPVRFFAQGGVHWSFYGAALAIEELYARIEKARGVRYQKIAVEGYELTSQPHDRDKDLVLLANIWDERRFYGLTPVPRLVKVAPDGARPLRVLFVGTSFLWLITDTLGEQGVCDKLDIYYYFKTRHRYRDGKGTDATADTQPLDELKLDYAKELVDYDAIVLEINEVALAQLGLGFIEKVLPAFGVEPRRTAGNR